MTIPNSPDVKVNNFKIRVSNHDLDVLHSRAKTVGMPMTQYIRWRAMQPIGKLKQTLKRAGEQKALAQSEIALYVAINKELNSQGINLNQITKAINSGNLEGKSIDHCLEDIKDIKRINQQILNSIAHLRASS